MSIIRNLLCRHARIAVSIGLAAAMAFSGAVMALADTGAPSGSGTALDPYIITTASQLANIPTLGLTKCYKLGNSIDLSGYGQWTPIGFGDKSSAYGYGCGKNPFTGTFDGNGYSITGLTIGTAASPYTGNEIGLFGHVGGATIENLHVDAQIYTARCVAGVLAGVVDEDSSGNLAVIRDCSTSGGITGGTTNNSETFGGMAGMSNGTFANDSSSVNVSGFNAVGGLIGQIGGGSVTDCFAVGTVTATGAGAGNGISGGFCGQNTKGAISNCYSTGAVSDNGYLSSEYLGGFVGQNDSSIENCYTTGNVQSSGNETGGFAGVGRGGGITNCYSRNTVIGANYVGGFIGANGGKATNCYSATVVDLATGSAPHAGGFAGYGTDNWSDGPETGTTASCYWDSAINPLVTGDNNGAIRDGTAGMAVQGFADTLNLNISSLPLSGAAAWKYVAAVNGGYPYLSGVGIGADTTPPTGTFSLSPSGSTPGPVTITLTATDSGSGVASITLPDGSAVSAATATYTVAADGTYPFAITDGAGNTAQLSETVSNIVATSSDPGGSSSSSSSSGGSSSSSGSGSPGNGSSSQTDTIDVEGTISASGISVTHPTGIAYTIDSSGKFASSEFPITNDSPGPISVTVESLRSVAGGTLQFTDVAPDAEDWGNLDLAGSKTYIALGIGADTSTGWSSGVSTDTFWAVDTTPMAVGDIASGGSASPVLTAHNGRVFDQSYTARHSLVLEFNLI